MSKASQTEYVPVYSCLPTPVDQEEMEQCRELSSAIQAIRKIRGWELEKPSRSHPPAVHVWYVGSCEPRPWWNKWLWTQIVTDHRLCLSWIGRLSALSPSRRELVLVPRPNRIDECLADQATSHRPLPNVHMLKLGVISTPFVTFRTFPVFH